MTQVLILHPGGHEATAAAKLAAPHNAAILESSGWDSLYHLHPKGAPLSEVEPVIEAYGQGHESARPGPVLETINKALRVGATNREHTMILAADFAIGTRFPEQATAAMRDFAAAGPVGPDLQGSQWRHVPDEIRARGDLAVDRALSQGAGRMERADMLHHGAILLHHEAFARVGAFDTSLPLEWSIRDWFVRLRETGWRRPTVTAGAYGQPVRLSRAIARLPDGSAYFAKWPVVAPKIMGLIVTRATSRERLRLLAITLRSMGPLVDGIQVVLHGGSPEGFAEDPGPPISGRQKWVTEPKDPNDPTRFADWVASESKVSRDAVDVAYAFDDPPNPDEITSLRIELEDARRAGRAVDVEELEHELVEVQKPRVLSPSYLEHLGATLIRREQGSAWILRLVEGEEIDATREELIRLASHPDPLVSSYNMETLCMITKDHHRIDAPFGDGGANTGQGAGASDWRMYRASAPRLATDGGRVSAIQIRQVGNIGQPMRQAGDAMTLAAIHAERGIGLHMLAYSGEDQDDLRRWLDLAYGIAAERVIGWTESGESEALETARKIADRFGAAVRMVAREDGSTHFGDWRNAAIADQSTPWAWFVDPDEWFPGVTAPDALLCLRRMVSSPTAWAYFGEALNLRRGAPPANSRTIRVWRHRGIPVEMRFNGRVHESLIRSLDVTMINRVHAVAGGRLRQSPAAFTLINRGMAEDPDATKAARYADLLRAELEEHPNSVAHLISLSADYLEKGHLEHRRALLSLAVEHAGPTDFLPYYERGMMALMEAKRDMRLARARLPPDAAEHRNATAALRSLESMPDLPSEEGEPIPLPSFLDVPAHLRGPSNKALIEEADISFGQVSFGQVVAE